MIESLLLGLIATLLTIAVYAPESLQRNFRDPKMDRAERCPPTTLAAWPMNELGADTVIESISLITRRLGGCGMTSLRATYKQITRLLRSHNLPDPGRRESGMRLR